MGTPKIKPSNSDAANGFNSHSTQPSPELRDRAPDESSDDDDEERISGLPTNFRNLPIVPRAKDMDANYEPFLRVAEKKYESTEHYLDVQFRLLREDLIRPLRLGIAAHKKGHKDLRVYRDIKLDDPILHLQTGEFIHYANIKVCSISHHDFSHPRDFRLPNKFFSTKQ